MFDESIIALNAALKAPIWCRPYSTYVWYKIANAETCSGKELTSYINVANHTAVVAGSKEKESFRPITTMYFHTRNFFRTQQFSSGHISFAFANPFHFESVFFAAYETYSYKCCAKWERKFYDSMKRVKREKNEKKINKKEKKNFAESSRHSKLSLRRNKILIEINSQKKFFFFSLWSFDKRRRRIQISNFSRHNDEHTTSDLMKCCSWCHEFFFCIFNVIALPSNWWSKMSSKALRNY